MARITTVLAATGERVNDAIGHALSQRNNHGISEAVGLLALGARFRGTHPAARHPTPRPPRLPGREGSALSRPPPSQANIPTQIRNPPGNPKSAQPGHLPI